jgi:hypothetical protein
MRQTRIDLELSAQRALFEHIIVAIDAHEYRLNNYRAPAPLFGIQ